MQLYLNLELDYNKKDALDHLRNNNSKKKYTKLLELPLIETYKNVS